jgi:hypothetical protein
VTCGPAAVPPRTSSTTAAGETPLLEAGTARSRRPAFGRRPIAAIRRLDLLVTNAGFAGSRFAYWPYAAYRYSASPTVRQSTGGLWRMTDASTWPAMLSLVAAGSDLRPRFT